MQKLASILLHLIDGEEALDFIRARGKYKERNKKVNPKVILLDQKLPKIDGLEVIKELKADISTRHIPIVMLSSSKEKIDVDSSYSYGVNSYIVKPVEVDDFMKVIPGISYYWMKLNQCIEQCLV